MIWREGTNPQCTAETLSIMICTFDINNTLK